MRRIRSTLSLSPLHPREPAARSPPSPSAWEPRGARTQSEIAHSKTRCERPPLVCLFLVWYGREGEEGDGSASAGTSRGGSRGAYFDCVSAGGRASHSEDRWRESRCGPVGCGGPRPLGDSEVRSHSQMGPVRRAASWWWWWWLIRDGRMSQCERLLRLTHGHQCAGSRGLARSRAGQWRPGGETCEGGQGSLVAVSGQRGQGEAVVDSGGVLPEGAI